MLHASIMGAFVVIMPAVVHLAFPRFGYRGAAVVATAAQIAVTAARWRLVVALDLEPHFREQAIDKFGEELNGRPLCEAREILNNKVAPDIRHINFFANSVSHLGNHWFGKEAFRLSTG